MCLYIVLLLYSIVYNLFNIYTITLITQDIRDWFLERIRLMVDDMLSVAEVRDKRARQNELGHSKHNFRNATTKIGDKVVMSKNLYKPEEINAIMQMKELMMRKIQVV